MEASIKICGRGQFVGKEGAVNFLVLPSLFKGVPVISARRTDAQSRYGKQHARFGKKRMFHGMPDSRQTETPDWHALAIHCGLTGLIEAASDFPVKGIQALIEKLPCLVTELHIFVHSSMPFALSAAARVCVAREQCVFTLPAEQPIAAAVSAISISSQ